MHGTTIVAVHRYGVSALAGDGQVSLGDTIVKRGAVKVRTLADGAVLAGFAGAVSDAFTLLDKFEGHLAASRNNLLKAAVETVKEWRTDRMLRNLEAMLVVADASQILSLSGHGDVIAPDAAVAPDAAIASDATVAPDATVAAVAPDATVAAVGSGGAYAQAAALALLRATDLPAEAIARRALAIAGEIDVFTSGSGTVLTVGGGTRRNGVDDQAGGDATEREAGDGAEGEA